MAQNDRITWTPLGIPSVHLGIMYTNPNIVTGGSVGRMENLAYRNLVGVVTEENKGRRFQTFHGTYIRDGHKLPVTAFATGMGTSSASLTLPEIAEARKMPESGIYGNGEPVNPAEIEAMVNPYHEKMRLVRIGTAGALQKGINVGDLVVATEARSYAAVAKFLMGVEYDPRLNHAFVSALETRAREHQLDWHEVHKGPIKIVPEAYIHNKTVPFVDHGDMVAVSMETSALKAYCDLLSRRGINPDLPIEVRQDLAENLPQRDMLGVTLLSVSDNPLEGHVDMGNYKGVKEPQVEEVQFRVALDALMDMHLADFKRDLVGGPELPEIEKRR